MGKLQIEGSDGPSQQQPLALLAYLAIAGPKTRDHLATVFWPQAKKPLNNLSSALSRVRDHLPDAVAVDQNLVTCNLPSDVLELQCAISAQDADAIVRLYHGHFFESSSLRMGLELEEWVFALREALAVSASTALLAAADQQSPAAAIEAASHAYRIGAAFWIEAELWQCCHRLLLSDVVKAEQLRVDAAQRGFVLSTGGVPPAEAPRTESEIYGRSHELAALDAFQASSLLPDGLPEWMAIVGMGGVGKTALATAWLAEIDQRHDGTSTYLAELADLRTADGLAEMVATQLGIAYSSDRAFLDELQRRCASAPVALVLDNMEQVDGYEPFLREVAAIDGLTTVVTTRIASGVSEERTLELSGLVDERAAAARAMFTAKALPICPEVVNHPAVVARACDLLDGHPLAIELVAAWLRTVPLVVAVDSLAESDELVSNSPHDSLESMDSLLDRSWMLLDVEQARVLGKLALFEGSFSYPDAMATTGTTLSVLSALVRSSLLTRQGDELILHPLVQGYAIAKLRNGDPLVVDDFERHFVEHFRQRMIQAARALRGPEAGKASPTVSAAFLNIQAAWRLALDRGDWQAVGDMADGMAAHLKSQSRLFLSAQLLGQAFERLAQAPGVRSTDPVLAKALVAVGWRYAMTRLVQGARAEAIEAVERCTLLCHSTDRVGLMGLSYVRGQIASFAGSYQEAAGHFATARSLADDDSQEWFVAEIETASAIISMSLEQMDEARRLSRSVLATGRRLGNPVIISDAYYCLGTLDFDDDPAAALVLLNEAREVAAAASLTQKSRKYAAVIGRCHLELDDAPTAKVVFEQALQDSDDGSGAHDEPWVRISNLSGLGMAMALTGDQERANALLSDAVRGVIELDDWPLMLETALEICRLRADQSSVPAWRTLLHVVASHEATLSEWQAEASALLGAAGCESAEQRVAVVDGTSLDRVAESALLLLSC